jgi:hypothetical protein
MTDKKRLLGVWIVVVLGMAGVAAFLMFGAGALA